MWNLLPLGVSHNIIARLSDQQAVKMRLTCKDWCLQPRLDHRARMKLNETLACRRLALKALKPVIEWDFHAAYMFRDLIATPEFETAFNTCVFSSETGRTWDDAVKEFDENTAHHHLLTEAVFQGPSTALQDVGLTTWC